MLIVSQNQLRILEVKELIVIKKGSPTNTEIEIRPIDSNLALGTYSSENQVKEVIDEYISARKRLYKLEHAKELLSPEEIEKIIEKDFIFRFPRDRMGKIL